MWGMEWHMGTQYCLLNFSANLKQFFKKSTNKTNKTPEGRVYIRRTVTYDTI